MGPRSITGLPVSVGLCPCAFCSSTHYLVLKKKYFLIEKVRWCCFSWAPWLWHRACICHSVLRKLDPMSPLFIARTQPPHFHSCCASCGSWEQLWDCPGPCGSCSPLYFSERRVGAPAPVGQVAAPCPCSPWGQGHQLCSHGCSPAVQETLPKAVFRLRFTICRETLLR